MKVKKITASVNDAQAVPQVLDNEGVSFQKIDIVNWKEYPYHPEAAFRIAHTADSILIHYKVTEGSVRAKYGEDNGAVWTDSCMEFFNSRRRWCVLQYGVQLYRHIFGRGRSRAE